jgi:DNA-binding FrmR family transcriptional regulator
VGKVILEHHIEECVGEAIRHADAEDAIRDLKRSLDRLF